MVFITDRISAFSSYNTWYVQPPKARLYNKCNHLLRVFNVSERMMYLLKLLIYEMKHPDMAL